MCNVIGCGTHNFKEEDNIHILAFHSPILFLRCWHFLHFIRWYVQGSFVKEWVIRPSSICISNRGRVEPFKLTVYSLRYVSWGFFSCTQISRCLQPFLRAQDERITITMTVNRICRGSGDQFWPVALEVHNVGMSPFSKPFIKNWFYPFTRAQRRRITNTLQMARFLMYPLQTRKQWPHSWGFWARNIWFHFLK